MFVNRAFVFVLCILFAFPLKGNADNTVVLDDVTIIVMPDYAKHPDKEGTNLLIGYHATVKNVTNHEWSKGFTIPLPTDDPYFHLNLVAEKKGTDEEAKMEELKNKINEKGRTVTIFPKDPIPANATLQFVVEYYVNPIKEVGESKSFSYTYKAVTNHNNVNLIVFEPLDSNQFKITPETEQKAQDTMGVKMQLFQYENMKQGEEKAIKVSYQKGSKWTTTELIDQHVAGASGEDVDQLPEPTKKADTNFKTEFITIGAGSLVGATAVFFLLKRKKRSFPK